MGELIDQGDLRRPRQDRIEIHFLEHGAAIGELLARDQIEAAEKLLGAGTAVGLDVGDDDIIAALLSLPPLAEHGERLSGSGRRAQVDLETPTRRCHKAIFPRGCGIVRERG